MKKHYFVVKIERIEVTGEQGCVVSSNDVISVVRKFRTKLEAEEFIRARGNRYYLLVLEG